MVASKESEPMTQAFLELCFFELCYRDLKKLSF